MFYVQDSRTPSHVTKLQNMIFISINSIEFYRVFKQAIDNYRNELTTDEGLQSHFICAWESIESHVYDISSNNQTSPEVEYLLNELKHFDSLNLFS